EGGGKREVVPGVRKRPGEAEGRAPPPDAKNSEDPDGRGNGGRHPPQPQQSAVHPRRQRRRPPLARPLPEAQGPAHEQYLPQPTRPHRRRGPAASRRLHRAARGDLKGLRNTHPPGIRSSTQTRKDRQRRKEKKGKRGISPCSLSPMSSRGIFPPLREPSRLSRRETPGGECGHRPPVGISPWPPP